MTPSSSVRGLLFLGLVLAGCAPVGAAAPSVVAAPALSAASPDPAATDTRVAPEPRGRPVVVASAPTPTDAPVAPTEALAISTVAPAPQACPVNFFCYPRLGIAGPILDYDDCSGLTDVGAAIRQLACVPQGIWLAGHAYTQFGRITGFRVGDLVFVRGQQFAITGSSVQRSCAPTTQAVAPLSLQTSLEATTCGRVIVVQGR